MKLPDTLCVHLKRFRHDYSFSSKISTKVSFPLSGLDLSPWLLCRQSEESHTYSLTGVICHHGVSGIGGHYTAYCRNPGDGQFYHYDDSSVRLVDEATVANSDSAYVLFYKKDANNDLKQARIEVNHGLKKQTDDSVIKSYIATAWLTKFFTMSQPGPIDNSSVMCRHGAVLPCRAANVSELVTPVSSQLYSYLHTRHGGSAAITSLAVCSRCEEEERQEAEQKEFELQQFKELHEGERSQESARYCVSAAWFRDWEAWVCNKAREPPGREILNCIPPFLISTYYPRSHQQQEPRHEPTDGSQSEGQCGSLQVRGGHLEVPPVSVRRRPGGAHQHGGRGAGLLALPRRGRRENSQSEVRGNAFGRLKLLFCQRSIV